MFFTCATPSRWIDGPQRKRTLADRHMKRQAYRKGKGDARNTAKKTALPLPVTAAAATPKPIEKSAFPTGVERLFTIEQIAQLGARCRASIYVDIKQGRLRAVKFGRSTRVRESDYRAYLESAPLL
jgi:excisionase family DNA binding protein